MEEIDYHQIDKSHLIILVPQIYLKYSMKLP